MLHFRAMAGHAVLYDGVPPEGCDPNGVVKLHLGVVATFQSLCKRGLGSNRIMTLLSQNQVLDIILHYLILFSCLTAPKAGPT